MFSIKRLRKEPKLNSRKQLISETHSAIQKDRAYLTSVLVGVIKKHWGILEDKLESYTEEDDYGNIIINNQFREDIYYFSERVVIPELKRHIDDNLTTCKNLTLIFANIASAIYSVSDDFSGIKYEDSNTAIASKILAKIDNRNLLPHLMTDNVLNDESVITDKVFHAICSDPSFIANHSDMRMSLSLNFDDTPDGISNALIEQSKITLGIGEDIKFYKPMTVPAFIGLVMVLFLAMHGNKKTNVPRKNNRIFEDFTGNDPYKYEEFIRKLLYAKGFSAKRTRGSGDYGVDVIASKNGKTYAIQCKLYNHTVGFKAVQEIVSGRVYYKTDFAVVVSDNSFTDAARSMARRSGVILTHHKNLLHKLVSLIPDDDDEPVVPVDHQINQESVAKKQWTQQDANELITVILPTISNDK